MYVIINLSKFIIRGMLFHGSIIRSKKYLSEWIWSIRQLDITKPITCAYFNEQRSTEKNLR